MPEKTNNAETIRAALAKRREARVRTLEIALGSLRAAATAAPVDWSRAHALALACERAGDALRDAPATSAAEGTK